jgi:hypothetical protein
MLVEVRPHARVPDAEHAEGVRHEHPDRRGRQRGGARELDELLGVHRELLRRRREGRSLDLAPELKDALDEIEIAIWRHLAQLAQREHPATPMQRGEQLESARTRLRRRVAQRAVQPRQHRDQQLLRRTAGAQHGAVVHPRRTGAQHGAVRVDEGGARPEQRGV